MSDRAPAFRWSNACIGGPRRTSKLAYGPLGAGDRKKMGLVNGVCPAMGSKFCFSQCDKEPPDDCLVMGDPDVLAGEHTTPGTPCQTCTLPCPCKVQIAVMSDTHFPLTAVADLAEQEARMLEHLHWWDMHCVTIREQS